MALLGGGGGREYVLKIIADVTDAVKGVDEVSTKTSTMKDKMLGVGKGVAAGLAVGAVVEFGKSTINAAADADDANDQMQAAFGETASYFDKFAKNAADNMGLSETAFKGMAAETGNLLQSVGINAGDAAVQTETMTQRAADMAAIWGTDVPTAMDAINKGMVGSTKGLTQFGVKISSAEVDARAMSKGYTDASGKVTDAGKAIAAQELILEKTSNVQGAYAENSKDLGSQQDILKAKMANLQAGIGKGLLPIITKLMEFAQPIIDFITENIDILGPLAIGIGAVTAAMWLWNAAMAANPITLVALAIAALIAGIVLLWTKVDWFREGILGMWDAIKGAFNWVAEHWPTILAIITGPIGIAVLLITKNWDTIKEGLQSVIDFIIDVGETIIEVITWPYRFAIAAIWEIIKVVGPYFTDVIDDIVGVLLRVWDTVTWPFVKAIDFVKDTVDKIKPYFEDAVRNITQALSNVWNVIKQPFIDGWNEASKAGKKVIDWFGGIWGSINNAFSGLVDVIKWPFETAFNAIKRLWNSTIGGFGFTIPSWVPNVGGKGFKIPEMAKGGIVNRPTIALIGEQGPEAVIPLSMLAALPAGFSATAASNVVINVYALTASAEVGRQVYEALREYERISGKPIGA